MNLQAWMSNRLTVTKQQKHALLHINLSNKMACMFRIWWYLPWPQPLYPVSNQLQCKNKICQNGGMCYILGDENMSQCVCRPGWKGPTCLIGGTSCFQILLPSLRGGQVRDLGPKRRWWARVRLHCDQETAFRVQPRGQVNLLTGTKDISSEIATNYFEISQVMYDWKNMFLWCLQSFTNDKECWENSERVTWHQRLKYSMTVRVRINCWCPAEVYICLEKKIETTRSKFSEFNEENFTISKLTNYILFLKKHTVFGLRETSEISDCSEWNKELCKNYTSNIEQRVRWTAHKTEKLFLYRNKCLYWSEVSEICFLGVNIIFYTKKRQIWIRSFVFLI